VNRFSLSTRAARRYHPRVESLEDRNLLSFAVYNYPAGRYDWSVAVGDFSNAGKLDVAISDLTGTQATLLSGNGDGTFQTPAHDYSAGSFETGIAVGDLNNDGNLDVVVTNSDVNRVSILYGNGDGTFQSPVTYAVGNGPEQVAVADLLGNGSLDIVTADRYSNTVSVLLNNGDGTFQSAVAYSTGAEPVSLAIGDVNGDGIPDIVTANLADGSISVLAGNGDGTFQPNVDTYVAPGLSSLVLGDFNNDGSLDVAATTEDTQGTGNPNSANILLNNGDGTFQPPVSYEIPGGILTAVAAGDFNQDGSLDLVTANYNRGSVSVLLNNGDGTFQNAQTYTVSARVRYVAVGDFNGDGYPDLVASDVYLGQVSILINNGYWSDSSGATPEHVVLPAKASTSEPIVPNQIQASHLTEQATSPAQVDQAFAAAPAQGHNLTWLWSETKIQQPALAEMPVNSLSGESI
jgi:hypothetical protein